MTEEAAARPRHTIHAAEIFHSQTGSIAIACDQAAPDDMVVASVDRFLSFAGIWTFPRHELTLRVPEVDAGGWTMVFSPGAGRNEIEARCLKLGQCAFKRWEALRRWESRHGDDVR